MTPRVIATFECSDDALRFAKMKGEDYMLCDGSVTLPWGVRPKDTQELGMGRPESPSELHTLTRSYDYEDGE